MITWEMVIPPTGDKWVRMTKDNVISCVPINESNTDYQAYLAWVAEGNTPETVES